MTGTLISIRILILAILLVLSAFFSSSETALTSLKIAKIRQLRETNEKKARLLERIKKKINTILSTILIGNNVVNILATAILTELTVEFFEGSSSTLIATGVMTILILIFGEITPKTFAAQNPEKVSMIVARPLEALSVIFKPILIVLNSITGFIIKILGGNVNYTGPFVTEEEIRSLVDVGEEEGVVKLHEKEMIENIFEIDDIDVSDVMVPRIDIIAISEDASMEMALEKITRNGHSRIPVYKENIDNIVGLLYAKDVLPFIGYKQKDINETKIIDIMRQPYYVPETKKVNKLLRELQQHKVHMAIVLDEYGGTEGLVTIEDILEEIVGDILDEYDNDIDMIEKIDETTYHIKAEVSLEDINELFNTDFPEDDFDSLGGYIFSTLGRVPKQGDTLEERGIKMVVKKVVNRRVKLVEITI
ncbi:HlyC/CorC family transporter [Clostridium sp. D2Q-11]|uniref:HlyC/CorC family transporter n=1 Tax=Anaeromonas frigoriresistens TaxID=2683708 RepID=A0A942Z761_9FIRM|nr:hemolysin family protein [Anaeromonas frigoriresistens]MBS4536903.1 HlyC/CorC family transporter [Anaeromonas frigoriresistens]